MGTDIKDSKKLFEQYSQQYLKFNEAQEKEQAKKSDLAQLESQYNLVLNKENTLEKEKQELLQVSGSSLQEAENGLREEFQKQFDEAQKEYENAVVTITEKRDNRISVNEERHFTGMAKFREEGRILSKHDLSELDQKLYEFAAHKEEILEAKLKKQNEIEDLKNHINLETDKGLTLLQRKQNDVYKEYENVIEEKADNVLAVEEKYFPDIQTIEEKIRSIEGKYEEIISEINYQHSKEVELLVTDKKAIEKQYKETDKRFKKQITVATKRNEPVAQLKAQHNAAIKNIQDAIAKKDSDINKLNFRYDKQVEDENGKRQKELNASLKDKEKLIQTKNSELSEPQKELEKVTNERNLKLNNLEIEKSGLEQQRGKALTEADINLKTFLLEADNKLEKIKKELITFASTNGLAVEEKSAEAYEPFEYMESNLPIWMNVVSHFIPEFGERNAAIDVCRNTMENMLYEELVDIVNTSDNYSKQIPFYLKNLKDKIIIAFAISILVGTILAFPLNMSVFIAYGVPILVSGIYSFVSIKKKRELRNKCCELIFLANNYQSLPQVNGRVQLLTDNATYEKVNEMADNIYQNVSGSELLQKKFENEERDIDNDYANEIALAKEQHERRKEIITSEGRKRVLELRKNHADEQKSKSDKLDAINSQINTTMQEKNKLSIQMEQVRGDLRAYEEVLASFEEKHMQFKKNLLHMSAPVEETKGVLRDDIYLIPTDYKKCSDKNGHLPFMHIVHEKHPILLTLDTQNIHKDGSYQEKLGTMVKTCLLDFALAFKNINGSEIIEQYIVDEISGGHELRSDDYKNLLRIKKVTEFVYDMQMYFNDFKKQREVFAHKGITLSDYNMMQTQKGERPGVYKICYIVLKNERCPGFSEHIASLMKKGWDYGFVPVFVCEKEIWESNKDKAGTVLNEISMNVTTIIKFNGKKYEELENE